MSAAETWPEVELTRQDIADRIEQLNVKIDRGLEIMAQHDKQTAEALAELVDAVRMIRPMLESPLARTLRGRHGGPARAKP